MATLYITECRTIAAVSNATFAQAPCMPGTAEQHLTITTTSTASSVFNSSTYFVMLATDATCSLAWSTNSTTATAVTTAQRMAAGEVRFYGVNPGGSVSVVSNS